MIPGLLWVLWANMNAKSLMLDPTFIHIAYNSMSVGSVWWSCIRNMFTAAIQYTKFWHVANSDVKFSLHLQWCMNMKCVFKEAQGLTRQTAWSHNSRPLYTATVYKGRLSKLTWGPLLSYHDFRSGLMNGKICLKPYFSNTCPAHVILSCQTISDQ